MGRLKVTIIQVLKKNALNMLLAIIGCAGLYLSIHYTAAWHKYLGDTPVNALVYAVIVVVFAVVLFEFSMALLLDHNKWGILTLLFWVGMVCYPIQSTTAGQHITTRVTQGGNDATYSKAEVDRRVAIPAIKVQIGEAEDNVARAKAFLDLWEARRADMQTPDGSKLDPKQERTIAVNIRAGQADLYTKQTIRNTLTDKLVILEASTIEGEEKQSVFAFYGEVFGWTDYGRIELFLAVFKGVILELVNSFCFMVILVNVKKRGPGVQPESVVNAPALTPLGAAQIATLPKTPLEAFVRYNFDTHRPKNGALMQRERALKFGIAQEEYEAFVNRGLVVGFLRTRHHKTYISSEYSGNDVLNELV